MKLVEYRRTVNSAKKIVSCESNPAPTVKEKKDRTSKKKKKKTSFEIEDERRKNKTKEELIAENKPRVAKYHPEYQIMNWDCGWYQIKALAKEYGKNQLDEFNVLYKALADKMRPMVFALGFLK